MNTKLLVGAVVVVGLIAVVAGAKMMGAKAPVSQQVMEVSVTPSPATETPATESAMAANQTVRTIAITGGNFSFSVPEIRAKKGETLKIVFTNEEGNHDWVIDEFNARTKKIAAGEKDEVTFTVDKTGTFEYYCSVGKHRQMGMKGNLIVE